jgi:glucosamine-6-phosphate deaminase
VVSANGSGYTLCDANAHYSCVRFIDEHLLRPLDAMLPPERRIRSENVLVPVPGWAGEIDLLLLGVGASDGHVGFNPPGSSLASETRVVELADSTRHDNLGTFPGFGGIDEVPRYGITIGLHTVVSAGRVRLLAFGAEKTAALARLLGSAGFDPAWPATVVHACGDAAIVTDDAAMSP